MYAIRFTLQAIEEKLEPNRLGGEEFQS